MASAAFAGITSRATCSCVQTALASPASLVWTSRATFALHSLLARSVGNLPRNSSDAAPSSSYSHLQCSGRARPCALGTTSMRRHSTARTVRSLSVHCAFSCQMATMRVINARVFSKSMLSKRKPWRIVKTQLRTTS